MDFKKLAEELVTYKFNLARVPKEANLNGSELVRGEKSVLGYLLEVQNAAAPSQIARFMGVSTARMASILNSLEKKGHIIREKDTIDKRKIIVNITESGMSTALQYRNHAIKMTTKLLTDLGEHDAKEHVRIMEKIYQITLEHEDEIFDKD